MQPKDEGVHMTKRRRLIQKYYEYSSGSSSDEDSNSAVYSRDKENIDGDKKSTANNYEERVQQARAERTAFLKELKIEEAKADLEEAANAMKGEKKPFRKIVYKKVPRSLRESNNNTVNYSEKAVFKRMMVEAINKVEDSEIRRHNTPPPSAYFIFMKGFRIKMKKKFKGNSTNMNKLCSETWRCMTDAEKHPYFEQHLKAKLRYQHYMKKCGRTIPPELKFEDAIFKDVKGLYANYAQDIDVYKPKFEPELIYDKSVVEHLTLKESNVKVTQDFVTALALYPSSQSIILAAGSIYGNLGIWNAVSESSPYRFKIHLGSITHLAFNPYNPIQLISSSFDGTLRCCDMKRHIFTEICKLSNAPFCTNFDFLSSTTYLVAENNEDVSIIDTRTKGYKREKKHSCNEIIECVNVHPVKKNIFLTGGCHGKIRLWDLRNLQQQPIAEIISHEKNIQAAYFSPISGDFILSSSCDSVCISDCSNLTDVKLMKDMRYSGVQVPLRAFKAAWLPYSEESFTIVDKKIAGKIQIYNKNFEVLHSIIHKKFVCVPQKIVFHPYKPFIFGNSKKGNTFMFTNLE